MKSQQFGKPKIPAQPSKSHLTDRSKTPIKKLTTVSISKVEKKIPNQSCSISKDKKSSSSFLVQTKKLENFSKTVHSDRFGSKNHTNLTDNKNSGTSAPEIKVKNEEKKDLSIPEKNVLVAKSEEYTLKETFYRFGNSLKRFSHYIQDQTPLTKQTISNFANYLKIFKLLVTTMKSTESSSLNTLLQTIQSYIDNVKILKDMKNKKISFDKAIYENLFVVFHIMEDFVIAEEDQGNIQS